VLIGYIRISGQVVGLGRCDKMTLPFCFGVVPVAVVIARKASMGFMYGKRCTSV
jgi:hypothetical protein